MNNRIQLNKKIDTIFVIVQDNYNDKNLKIDINNFVVECTAECSECECTGLWYTNPFTQCHLFIKIKQAKPNSVFLRKFRVFEVVHCLL